VEEAEIMEMRYAGMDDYPWLKDHEQCISGKPPRNKIANGLAQEPGWLIGLPKNTCFIKNWRFLRACCSKN
jgi:hypothetical protein